MSNLFPDLFQTFPNQFTRTVVSSCLLARAIHAQPSNLKTSPNRARKSIAHLSKAISVKRFSFKLLLHTSLQPSCAGVTCAGRLKSNELTPERLSEFKVSIRNSLQNAMNVLHPPKFIQTKKNDPTSTEMSWCTCVMEPMTVSLSEVASIA